MEERLVLRDREKISMNVLYVSKKKLINNKKFQEHFDGKII